MMNKKLLPILIGLVILMLSACAANATPAPAQPVPATAISSQPAPATAIPAAESATATSAQAPASTVSFAKDVMPIIQNSCAKCHGIEAVKKGLDMTSYDKLMAGSFEGAVITPGNANGSKLADLIVRGEMPKRGDPLPPDQIQIIINWINAGALNN